MYLNPSRFTVTGTLSRALTGLLLCCFALALGCQHAPSPARQAKLTELRQSLPYVTRIVGHSMETVLPTGTIQLVRPLEYYKIQSGTAVVYWPEGSPIPICHFADRRIGTDSWTTAGMNGKADVTYLGFLLTRDNYIGVIW